MAHSGCRSGIHPFWGVWFDIPVERLKISEQGIRRRPGITGDDANVPRRDGHRNWRHDHGPTASPLFHNTCGARPKSTWFPRSACRSPLLATAVPAVGTKGSHAWQGCSPRPDRLCERSVDHVPAAGRGTADDWTGAPGNHSRCSLPAAHGCKGPLDVMPATGAGAAAVWLTTSPRSIQPVDATAHGGVSG